MTKKKTATRKQYPREYQFEHATRAIDAGRGGANLVGKQLNIHPTVVRGWMRRVQMGELTLPMPAAELAGPGVAKPWARGEPVRLKKPDVHGAEPNGAKSNGNGAAAINAELEAFAATASVHVDSTLRAQVAAQAEEIKRLKSIVRTALRLD